MKEPLLRTDPVQLYIVRRRRPIIIEDHTAKKVREKMYDVLFKKWLDVPEIIPTFKII